MELSTPGCKIFYNASTQLKQRLHVAARLHQLIIIDVQQLVGF